MYDGLGGPIKDMVVKATRHQPSAQTRLGSSNRNESNAPETPPGPEASLLIRPGRPLAASASSSAARQPHIASPSWPISQPVSSPPIPNAPGNRVPDVWQTPANSQSALVQRLAQSAAPHNATQNPYYPNHYSINTTSTTPSRTSAGAPQVLARPSRQTLGQALMQGISPPPPAQAVMRTASPSPPDQTVTQITSSQPPPISKLDTIRPLSPESPYEPIVSWRRAHDFNKEYENFHRIVYRNKDSLRKTGIPSPVPIRLPECSVSHGGAGQNYPFLICHDCHGMPTISPFAASLVASSNSYPDSQHKADHKLHIWTLGFVLHTGHLTFGGEESAIDDVFGPQYAIQDLEQEFLNIGSTKIGAGREAFQSDSLRCELAGAKCVNGPLHVLNFGARPYGFLRLLLNSVPPGDWTVTFQISTWPAKKRGVINKLRAPSIDDESPSADRRMVVRRRGHPGGQQIGRIGFGLSKVIDVEQFFDEEEDGILKGWRHWAVNCELPPSIPVSPFRNLDLQNWIVWVKGPISPIVVHIRQANLSQPLRLVRIETSTSKSPRHMSSVQMRRSPSLLPTTLQI
jgi:hypothetical protein